MSKKPELIRSMQLPPVMLQRQERYLPSAFDDSLSVLEKVNKVIHYLYEYNNITDEMLFKWNEVYHWVMEDGLNESVMDKLKQMIDDGTFNEIINDQLLGMKADKVDVDARGYNIKSFGVVGDGKADDTVNFQKALTFINSIGGGILFIPKGTYLISTTLRIHKNTTLHFHPLATVKWNGDPNGKTIFLNGLLGSGNYASGYSGDGNIHIINGIIDLNGSSNPPLSSTGYGTVAFAIAHAKNVTFTNVTMQNGYNNHYIDFCGVNGGEFRNCTFKDMYVQGTAQYEALQIDLTSDNGFPYFGSNDNTPTINVLVENCHFESVHSGVGSHASRIVNGKQVLFDNIKIVNCTFNKTVKTAIAIDSFGNSILSSNVIKNCGEHGISLRGSENIELNGNIIDGVGEHGVVTTSKSIDSQTFLCREISIIGGSYKHCGQSGIRPLDVKKITIKNVSISEISQYGVNGTNADDVEISNNVIYNTTKSTGDFFPVRLSNCQRVNVFDNVISNEETTKKFQFGVSVSSGSDKVTTKDNKIIGYTERPINSSRNATIFERERYLTSIMSDTSGVISLNDDINNYRYLIVVTGTVASGTVKHSIVRGWYDQGFRSGLDTIIADTYDGKFIADVVSLTSLRIVASDNEFRYIIGVI